MWIQFVKLDDIIREVHKQVRFIMLNNKHVKVKRYCSNELWNIYIVQHMSRFTQQGKQFSHPYSALCMWKYLMYSHGHESTITGFGQNAGFKFFQKVFWIIDSSTEIKSMKMWLLKYGTLKTTKDYWTFCRYRSGTGRSQNLDWTGAPVQWTVISLLGDAPFCTFWRGYLRLTWYLML